MPKPCSYPNCRTLVGFGRCEKHKTPRKKKTVDPFYKDKRWYRAREKVLMRDDRKCVMCHQDVSEKNAAVIDHIIPLKDAPHLALALENLRTLCRRCDNKRHGDKGAFGFQPAPIRIVKRSDSKDWSF